MKLVVLGANGRTGKHVLQAALEKDMDVTAVVRSADKCLGIQHERLRFAVGDPSDPTFLKQVLRGQDAVVSTLGGRRPTRAATAIYYRSAEAILEAAWETGLKRVLVTSTALLFHEQTQIGRFLRLIFPNVIRSAARMEEIFETSGLNWTTVRSGFLNDTDNACYMATKAGPAKGGTSVSRRALAQFLIDAIDDPAAFGAAFGVTSVAA